MSGEKMVKTDNGLIFDHADERCILTLFDAALLDGSRALMANVVCYDESTGHEHSYFGEYAHDAKEASIKNIMTAGGSGVFGVPSRF